MRKDPVTAPIPVAILSADATPGQIERLRALGAQHYFTKPIDVNRLLQLFDDTAAGRRGNEDEN
jgi:CheY-like chemotaxis protein